MPFFVDCLEKSYEKMVCICEKSRLYGNWEKI